MTPAIGFRSVRMQSLPPLEPFAGDVWGTNGPRSSSLAFRARYSSGRMLESFGPYIIEGELGSGGMGVVYRARHVELDRPCALKVLKESIAGTGRNRERFHREALAAARLRHPGIVEVYDAGMVGDTAYIALELVDGEPLDFEPHTLRRRVELLAEIAAAVAHAHAHGVVHRDLKPGNILVGPDGRPRVLDFGLAHLVGSSFDLTREGSVVGTPLYMSPEQVEGGAIDARADVYALGGLLYLALAGQPPFRADSAAELYHHILTDDPGPIPSAPPALFTVACKALAKDPASRYVGAREFEADLRRWLAGEPILAVPPSSASRVARLLRRRSTLVAASIGFVVALILVVRWIDARREANRAADRLTDAQLFLPIEGELDILRMQFYRPGFRMTQDLFGRFEDIERRIRARMRDSGDSAPGHYLAGRCREVAGDGRGADREYEEALGLASDHGASLIALGRLRARRAFFDRAITRPQSARAQRALSEAREAAILIRRGERAGGSGAAVPLAVARMYATLIERPAWADEDFIVQEYERLKSEPFSEELLIALAYAGTFEGTRQAATRAIDRMPGFVEAYLWRAFAHVRLGDRAAALHDLDLAIDINPRFAFAWFARASCRAESGRETEALADFDRALELDPSMAQARAQRAMLMARSDPAATLPDLESALKSDPLISETRVTRSFVLRTLGRAPEALADASRGAELDPGWSEAHLELARVLRDLGRDDELMPTLNRVLELDAACLAALLMRGEQHFARGAVGAAFADFDQAVKVDPREPHALVNRAAVHVARGEMKLAHEDLDRALALSKNLPLAYYNRARIWVAESRWPEAIAQLDRANELKPLDFDTLSCRGLANWQNRNYTRAIEDYTTALAVRPNEPRVLANRGLVRQETGDRAGARADFARALEFAPPDWKHRSMVEAQLKAVEKP